MITLYELHWSHYCEKVRLALDYMKLPWHAVGIDAFSKKEFSDRPRPAHLPSYTVPAIQDEKTGAFVFDSTPILRYLADTYPEAPQLFPGDSINRSTIDRKLIEFDTQLGIPARRFGYTQAILECPDLLADLFLSHRAGRFFCSPFIRSIAGHVLGLALSKRFEFHRSESLGLYEALERYLLSLADEIEAKEFVVGDRFSAADLALAAQLRPLTIVPYFAENPELLSLFVRHREVIRRWSREQVSQYQLAIEQARKTRPPYRRKLRDVNASLPFHAHENLAANDQQAIWTWGMIIMPFHYLVSLRQGKVRQSIASLAAR